MLQTKPTQPTHKSLDTHPPTITICQRGMYMSVCVCVVQFSKRTKDPMFTTQTQKSKTHTSHTHIHTHHTQLFFFMGNCHDPYEQHDMSQYDNFHLDDSNDTIHWDEYFPRQELCHPIAKYDHVHDDHDPFPVVVAPP